MTVVVTTLGFKGLIYGMYFLYNMREGEGVGGEGHARVSINRTLSFTIPYK